MVITTNGIMEWMFNMMRACIFIYILLGERCKVVKMTNQQ
jgi:hypothetical protein